MGQVSQQEPSVFTKIINGEIPCHKVYEDEKTFAFMDIHPLQLGHVLVIPKIQVDKFDELDDENYKALFSTVKKLSKTLRETFQTTRTVTLIFGYDVPHAHVHLVPSSNPIEVNSAIGRFSEIQKIEPDHEELEKLAEKIRSNIDE